MRKQSEDIEAWQIANQLLAMFNLDLNKLLKLKNSVESENKKAYALVLPQPEILGLKIEFSDKAISPGIRWIQK